jgi:hypothetical protein
MLRGAFQTEFGDAITLDAVSLPEPGGGLPVAAALMWLGRRKPRLRPRAPAPSRGSGAAA